MQTVDDERLAEAVHGSHTAFLEPVSGDPADGVAVGPLFAPTLGMRAGGALYFWLTTATAFQVPTTARFCDGLVERGGVSRERRVDVELALQEAVANALVHGNLGLSSDMRDDFRQYERFCHLLEERLRDPDARHRRIEIAATWSGGVLEVSVTDQGQGYVQTDDPRKEAETGLPLHGLGIIHTIALSVESGDGGRRLTMRFAS
ncbi:MAG: ATP-binding protein [Alphaproteobacteria bacterium]|nr:ATP-binding protein [Alphaproteobacteria bacterium]